MNRQKTINKPPTGVKTGKGFSSKQVVLNIAAPPKSSDKVITRLVQQATSRSRKDIKDWRAALQRAENIFYPNRILLYNLYDELVLDNHISSLIDKYKGHVNGKAFVITDKKTKEVDADLTALLDAEWFAQLCEYVVETMFEGHSLIQFNEVTKDNVVIELVPRRHVVPDLGAFTITSFDTNYINFRNNPDMMMYLIELGTPKSLGLLNKAAPNILYKKNATIAWAEYCDIFGMPMRVGKTNSRNSGDLDRMETALLDMGKAAYAVINEGEEISFIESTKGDAFNVYDKLIERMNSEMSKLALGETMTTDVGANGSRAQAQVHEGVSDRVEDMNMQRVKRMVETKLFPLLTLHGFDFSNKSFIWLIPKTVSIDSFQQDIWLNDNFEIDPNHFAEKYNVPIKSAKIKMSMNNDGSLKTALKNVLKGNVSNIAQMHFQIQQLYNTHKH